MRRPLMGDEIGGRDLLVAGGGCARRARSCSILWAMIVTAVVVPIAPVLARLAPCHPCGHDSAGDAGCRIPVTSARAGSISSSAMRALIGPGQSGWLPS